MTPPTGEIPAPSGAAATTPCQRVCSRLVIAGVRSGPSPIVHCWEVLITAPASGPEWTNTLWRRLRSVSIARPFVTPAGNAWQNLLPPLPRTLGVLVLLSRLQLSMVAQGVVARCKSACSPIPFSFCRHCIVRLTSYCVVLLSYRIC